MIRLVYTKHQGSSKKTSKKKESKTLKNLLKLKNAYRKRQ